MPSEPNALQDTALRIVDKLVKRGKVDRRLIWVTIVSVVLDISLSVLVVFLFNGISSDQNSIEQVNITQCETANAARADDQVLWDTFITDLTPPGTKLTPVLMAEIAHLKAILNAKDAPRDCFRIYG